MKDQNNIINPITHNKDFRIVDEIDVRKLCNSYLELLKIDVNDYFKNITTIYLCECNITKYKFFFPFTISGDDAFYRSLQKYDWYYPKNKWEFDTARNEIDKGSLLEIGCGKGDFIESISHRENLKVQGIEYNLDAIRICQGKQLFVDKTKLEDLPDSKFDYVASFQVLEHIVDIKHFFENSNRMLKNRAKLIIGVPNTQSHIFGPFSDYYFEHGSLILNMPPHHVGWWDEYSLEKVASFFGFSLVNKYYEPLTKFRSDLFINNLENSFKKEFLRTFAYLIKSLLQGKLFIGDTLLTVFEKRNEKSAIYLP
jgi:SAM-dependent methyltransferase